MPLPTDRTALNTIAEHLSDHNTLHGEFNAPTHTHSGTYGRLVPAPTGVAATDTAILQAAHDGAYGELIFSAGTYVINPFIVTSPGQRWTLSKLTTIRAADAGKLLRINAADVTIDGGIFDSNNVGAGLYIAGDNVTVRGATLKNSGDYGVFISECNNAAVRDNHVYGNAHIGIFGHANALNCAVKDNYVESTSATVGAHCIAFHPTTAGKKCDGAKVSGNTCLVSAPTGFCIEIGAFGGDSPVGVAVNDNTCLLGSAGTAGGISLDTCVNPTVGLNRYYEQGHITGRGIEIVKCDGATVIGNTLYSTLTQWAITLDTSSGGTCSGNVIHGFGDAGIYIGTSRVAGTARRNVVTGNRIDFTAAAAAGRGIWVQSNDAAADCSSNVLTGNSVRGVSLSTGQGIFLELDSGTLDSTQVVGNLLDNVAIQINHLADTNTKELGNTGTAGAYGGGSPGAGQNILGTGHATATGAHTAAGITNTPAGTIAATTVQAAINELDTDLAASIVTNAISFIGTAGNYVHTPDSAVLSIVGDISMWIDLAMADWTPAADTGFIAKYAGAGFRSFLFRIRPTGVINFLWSANGTATAFSADSTVGIGLANLARKKIGVTLDVDNGAGGNDVKFYVSDDGVTWTQLGTTVTQAGVTSIFDSTQLLELCSTTGGTSDRLTGNLFGAQIYSGVGFTSPPVGWFDPTVLSRAARAPSTVTLNGVTWDISGGTWNWIRAAA